MRSATLRRARCSARWAMSRRLHGGGLRLVRHRDRQLHAARHGRRPVGAAARGAAAAAAVPRLRAGAPRRRPPARPVLRALAGAAAWVATEWLVPKLLGDTLGYGLYPSRLLRQAADLGGAAGITFAAAAGQRRRRGGARAPARRRARDGRAAGACRAGAAAAGGLRPGRARRRAAQPAPASRCASAWCSRTSSTTSACAARRAPTRWCARCSTRTTRCRATPSSGSTRDAVLWSETVYPTTFGQPKSEAGAELDREILDFVNAAGVPLRLRHLRPRRGRRIQRRRLRRAGHGHCSASTARRGLFLLTEYVPGVAGRRRRCAAAALGRHLAAGRRRARVSAAPGRRPRDPGAAADLPGRRRRRPGRRRRAARRAGDPDDVERLPGSPTTRRARAAPGGGGVPQHRDAPAAVPRHHQRLQRGDRRDRHRDRRHAHGRTHAGGRRRAGARAAAHADGGLGRLGRARGRGVPRAAGRGAGWRALAARARRGRTAGTGRCGSPARRRRRAAARRAPGRRAAACLRARAACSGWLRRSLFGDGALQANTLAQIRMFAALFLAPEAAAWCVLRAFARARLRSKTARWC